MNFSDDQLIPISYISQYEYCKRRAALLFLEQQWEDNIHTSEGTIIHERVHSGLTESRSDSIILRNVDLVSYEIGLIGKSDYIELTRDINGYELPWLDGKWIICPVEYKHGVVRNEYEYELQVCAQAMCLEQMCNCRIEFGYIYYEGDHRRFKVIFDDKRRRKVKQIAQELHIMQKNLLTPTANKTKRCKGCSMKDVCLPGKLKNPSSYIENMLGEAGEVVK